MRLCSRQLISAVAGMSVVWLSGVALVGQAAAQGGPAAARPQQEMAGQFFKNVTTSTLKGLTVADFLGSMGVMAAALSFDCSNCHTGAGTDKVIWEADTSLKRTARGMVEMVAAINRNYFPGTPRVTCWTCHHGRDFPTTTVGLDALYGPPNEENDDIVTEAPGQPSANQILDKYIEALGGVQRLSGLASFVATGATSGYEDLGGVGQFQIFAKAPNQRTTVIEYKEHPERGKSSWVYDGRTGWISLPRALLRDWELAGGELEGARLEAQLSFPGQIKEVFSNWHVGQPDSIAGRRVQVIQGGSPNGLLATLYFDSESGLLVRLLRFSASPIGRVPTQIDYSDYRDVGGIKFPFKYTFSWLDGRDSFQLNDVKTNVPIDAAKFAKPF